MSMAGNDGLKSAGGTPSASQVLAALVGQAISAASGLFSGTVTALRFVSTTTVASAFQSAGADGQFALQIGAGSTGLFPSASGSQLTLQISSNPVWVGTTALFSVPNAISFLNFTDGSGTTGNQTLNTVRGVAAIAAAGSSCTITNSFVSATSLVVPVLQTVDTTAKSVVATPAAGSVLFTLGAAATDATLTDTLWDGGRSWAGGPGATTCVATCTKGNQTLVHPGDMVCMSPGSARVTRGDGGTLGVLAEGAYIANSLGESRNFASPQWAKQASIAGEEPIVTPNVCVDPMGAMLGDRVQFPPVAVGHYSRLLSFHGIGGAGGDVSLSVYFANYDGGVCLPDGGGSCQHPDLAFNRSADIIGTTCTSTGSGDGGLLYARCEAPWAPEDISASAFIGELSLDGGSAPGLDLCVYGAQAENSHFATSYIPNDAPGIGDGSGTAAQRRGVDVIGSIVPITSTIHNVSMSEDVFAPLGYQKTSSKFESLGNGTLDFYVEMDSAHINNDVDFSVFSHLHMNTDIVVGVYPTQILPANWNHMSLHIQEDAGRSSVTLNGAMDGGDIGVGAMSDFLPLGHGFLPIPDGGFLNLCGDVTGTHAAWGICRDVCLSLNGDGPCQ